MCSFSPTAHGHQGVHAVRADKDGVKLYFQAGKGLPDPEKLLRGSGGKVRYVELENAATLKEPAVDAVIEAAIGRRNGPVPWHVVKVPGTGHFSFSDAPFQMQVQLRQVGATMTPAHMHRVTEELLLDFFGHYLEGRALGRLRPGTTTIP